MYTDDSMRDESRIWQDVEGLLGWDILKPEGALKNDRAAAASCTAVRCALSVWPPWFPEERAVAI